MNNDVEKIIDQIRTNKDYFHKAKLLKFLVHDKEIPIKDLSGYLSLKPSYICHILRLNKLPEVIIDGYYSKLVTISHLFIISRLKDQEKMFEVYEKMLGNNLTVLQTEYLIRKENYNVETEGDRIGDDEISSLESSIRKESKDVVVKLIQSRIKSKLIIEVMGNQKKTSEFLRNLMNKL